jgi:hypothetical protein
MTKLTAAIRKFANAPKKRKETTVLNNMALYDRPDTAKVSMTNTEKVN